MSAEVFETPEATPFVAYAAVGGGSNSRPSHTEDLDRSRMELDDDAMAPSAAFEVFMGKVYKPTEFETTGSVSSAVNGSAAKPLESPLARFTRLKMEIKELESDLTALADSAETQKQNSLKDATQDAECDELLRGLATLQTNLSAMALTPSFEPFLRLASPAGVGSINGDAALALQKQLTSQFFKQIEAIKSQQQGRSADSGGDAPIVYEIYSNGELNTVEKDAQTRMQILESRIATLEKTIGNAQDQDFGLDSLSAAMGSSSSNSSNLSAVVAQLETRVGLLNEKNLDALKTRTTALVHEFSLMHKLKESPGVQSALNSQADREKIGQIYDKMTRLDDVAASVPALVDRLMTLKSIHDDSLDMTTRVKKMEQSQETLAELLEADAAVLDNMEKSLAENVQIFQANIQKLDERMEKLLGATS